MKRAIISKYMQLSEKLTSYVAIMNYRFMNLCVKAEEASLLPVTINIEGDPLKFEEAADVAKKNDYEFMVFPKFEDDILEVSKGIALSHPEFKQKIEELPVESVNDSGQTVNQNVKYILLTMPEVDDERYDVLRNGVKSIYEECKAQMEAANGKAQADLAPLTAGEPEEDIEQLKREIDKVNKEKGELRDQLYEEKLQEIKTAYKQWLSNYAKSEIENMKKEDAAGTEVVSSMRMDYYNE